MELNLKLDNKLRASVASAIKSLTPNDKQSLTSAFANFHIPKKINKQIKKCFCVNCNKIINMERDYDYDDDTGFYRCENCMPAEQEDDCCERCEKPFNNTRKKKTNCCDCVYEDDGTIYTLDEWSQLCAKK